MPNDQPFGETWAGQDAALRAPLAVVPDDNEPDAEDPDEDEEGVGGLNPPHSVMPAGVPGRTPPVIDPEALVTVYCIVDATSNTKSGWSARLEVENENAKRFIPLLREQAYRMKVQTFDSGGNVLLDFVVADDGCTVERVTFARSGEGVAKVNLKFTSDQMSGAGPFGMLTPQDTGPVVISLYEVQMTLDFATKA